jgi:hypothetical protein
MERSHFQESVHVRIPVHLHDMVNGFWCAQTLDKDMVDPAGCSASGCVRRPATSCARCAVRANRTHGRRRAMWSPLAASPAWSVSPPSAPPPVSSMSFGPPARPLPAGRRSTAMAGRTTARGPGNPSGTVLRSRMSDTSPPRLSRAPRKPVWGPRSPCPLVSPARGRRFGSLNPSCSAVPRPGRSPVPDSHRATGVAQAANPIGSIRITAGPMA